ncbi:MAG: ATP-binding protein [Myxococcota bacterium]
MIGKLYRLINPMSVPEPGDGRHRDWHERLHGALAAALACGMLALTIAQVSTRGPLDPRTWLAAAELIVIGGCLIYSLRGGRWKISSVVVFSSVLFLNTFMDAQSTTNDAAISVGLAVWLVSLVFLHGHRIAWPGLGIVLAARVVGISLAGGGFGKEQITIFLSASTGLLILAGTLWVAEKARKQAHSLAFDRTRMAEQSAEEARSLVDAKSQFLAVMSHEIRTPINGVVNLARLLHDTGLSEEQLGLVSTLQTSTDSLVRVLNDVLDFSKIEAGQLRYEEVAVSPGDLIRSVAEFYEPAAFEQGISIQVDIEPSVPAWGRADPTRVRQVLNNLVSNAIKFTLNGTVTVRAHMQAQDQLCVSVTDTGIGIDAAAASHLFEAFAQADATTTRRFGGTGLGLAICKRLCEGMGGEISFHSHPGEGSTFSIRLPLPRCEAPTETERRRARTSFPNAKLLVAEDNSVNQLVIVGLLRRFDITPVVVCNGIEAVQHARNHPVDLILMDLHMPIMDGLEATEEIRSLGLRCPIVALTASALDSDRRRCLNAGMNEHLSKPLDPDALESVLTGWLRDGPSSVSDLRAVKAAS